jgi:MFS family permease
MLFLSSLLVTVLFLPESPRWLVSKGRMKEARAVLRMLRGHEDVDGEMALLVEGLSTSGETAIEEYEYIISTRSCSMLAAAKEEDKERDMSWVASRQGSSLLVAGLAASRQGSMLDHLRDPVVALLGSVHDLVEPPAPAGLEQGGGSMLFSNNVNTQGSMLSFYGDRNTDWDDEGDVQDDDGLRSPLLELDARGANTMGIGSGWQLAYKSTSSGVQRMYLHEEGSGCEAGVYASAIVSQSALYGNGNGSRLEVVDGFVHPVVVSEDKSATAGWRQLLVPGVRHALACGVTMQILQQFSGINGVLYYTPQILDQAGVSVLLASLGLSAASASASILISGVTTLLMLPAIGVAMWLMDASGRRSLLLWTIPVLIASLVATSVVPMVAAAHAGVATGSVMVYLCCFVMGFGPIPNILCAEIFPTRVRGLCITVCSLVFWLGDIAVTYSLPVMLKAVGLAGVFGFPPSAAPRSPSWRCGCRRPRVCRSRSSSSSSSSDRRLLQQWVHSTERSFFFPFLLCFSQVPSVYWIGFVSSSPPPPHRGVRFLYYYFFSSQRGGVQFLYYYY